MSVLKSKRKPSQFEVFHHLNKMRKEVTDLLLRDFGYDLDKAVKKVETTFGGRPYEELSPDEKVRYEKLMMCCWSCLSSMSMMNTPYGFCEIP